MSVCRNLVCADFPLAVVYGEMSCILAVRSIGIQCTDLIDTVNMLEFLCNLRIVGSNNLEQRQCSVKEDLIG